MRPRGETMKRFVALGCNHAAATLEQVAQARIPADRLAATLTQLKQALGAEELVYLATCHRTEWYLAYEGELCTGRLTMILAPQLAFLTGGAASLPPVERCLTLRGREAAEHLFRVACALDSLMLGETQVLGQVKAAYSTSRELGLAGPILGTLFTQAFRAAKRVRTETFLCHGPVSLVSLAERHLRARLADDHRPVAVLGAGEMAGQTLALFRKLDQAREVVVFNRDPERGTRLAQQYDASYRPLDDFASEAATFAAVGAATSAPSPLITGKLAEKLSPVLLLDLGLPANVAPECAAVPGVELVDQNVLAVEAARNQAARAAEVSHADALVEEQLAELAYELMEHQLSPVARRLLEAFRELTNLELQRACSQGAVNGNGNLEELVERLTRRLVRVPLRGLREVAWQYSPEVLDTFLQAVEQ
jgi:glutamyl-tRNA reductase